MKKCKNCGRQYQDEEQFCGVCGIPLEEKKRKSRMGIIIGAVAGGTLLIGAAVAGLLLWGIPGAGSRTEEIQREASAEESEKTKKAAETEDNGSDPEETKAAGTSEDEGDGGWKFGQEKETDVRQETEAQEEEADVRQETEAQEEEADALGESEAQEEGTDRPQEPQTQEEEGTLDAEVLGEETELSQELAPLQEETAAIQEPETELYVTYYVVNCEESITLRRTPDVKGQEICQIPFGAPVSFVKAAENGFYQIIYNGKTGYGLASYLALSPQERSEAATGYYQVVNCRESITLRTSPSTDAGEYCQIPLGAVVEYQGESSGDFYKVEYEGYVGYALKRYLQRI